MSNHLTEPSPSLPSRNNQPPDDNTIIPRTSLSPAPAATDISTYPISDIEPTPRRTPELTVQVDGYDPLEPRSPIQRASPSTARRDSRFTSSLHAPTHARQYQPFPQSIYTSGRGPRQEHSVRPLNVQLRRGEPLVHSQAPIASIPRTPRSSPQREVYRDADTYIDAIMDRAPSPTSSQQSAINQADPLESIFPSRADDPETWDNTKELRVAHPLVKRMEAHRYNLDMDVNTARVSIRIESSGLCSHVCLTATDESSISIYFDSPNRSTETS
jgi:hypothetical protein